MRATLITCAAILLVAGTASGEIPECISYQGRVTDNSGVPVADGTYDMRFRIYDAETGGNLEWDSATQSVQVEGGVFSVLLGDSPQPALNLLFDEDYWLLVTFDGVNQTPRQRLTSAGYAYMASGLVPGTEVSGSVAGGSAIRGYNTSTSGWVYGGVFDVETETGETGVGVLGRNFGYSGTENYGGRFITWSTSGRGVKGEALASTGTNYGGHFENASSSGRGVYAYTSHASGTTYAGKFHSASTSGTGVYGYAMANTGTNYGVHGETDSPAGVGVYGEGPDLGVSGYASATTGVVYGGYFESPSDQASAVRAFATSTTGVTYGIYGRSYSETDGSIGVYGRSSYNTTVGETWGVYGLSEGHGGRGVYGRSSNTSVNSDGRGGYFLSNGGLGVGVEGEAPNIGVRAAATATVGTNYGLSATSSSASGWAGYFAGNVHVTGTLSKGGGSFVIDHPLDPENKLLRHNFVESPENLLIYRGTAKLDSQGEAVVEMPEYFEALTKESEASVHLTPEGKPFLTGYRWQADHTAFTAYGDPNREVAWMVMADRDDPVMRQLARPVEEEKSPSSSFCDKGELLYPTAYGYPETTGRNHKIFLPVNLQPVEEPQDWRPTAAGERVEPDRTNDDADVMEVGDAR